MEKSSVLDVVFITDENYIMPTIVAITSLYKNKLETSQYFIHVLCSNVCEQDIHSIECLNAHNFKVEVIQTSSAIDNEKFKIEKLHVSTAALCKFDLGNIFSDLDRILYLDGDVLIQSDLAELFETDISNVYAAVVKDYKPMTYNPPQVKKLKTNHTAYFNSGVMLLNLKNIRKDNLYEKLVDYRINGINYFMDQDALNVVFKENVVYLPLCYNVMSSVMGFFTFEQLKEYYQLQSNGKDEIYENAKIVHLCSKYKPWDYYNVPFANEWKYYYENSSVKKPLQRMKLEEFENNTFMNFDLDKKDNKNQVLPEIIISLTSFPARIHQVHITIESLFKQKFKANKIILWLASSQFPSKEKDLPKELLDLKDAGLMIEWCEDIRPHKKYFYTMQAYPEDVVITVDDDVIYPDTLIETLINSYKKYPYAVSAMRVHHMKITEEGIFAPYNEWKRNVQNFDMPSLNLLPTGVGGVLYPPHCLHEEVFNIDKIRELCINADDLWLKVMQVMNNTPVVAAGRLGKIEFVDGSQEVALWKTNDMQGHNDEQLLAIIEEYNEYFGKKDTLMRRLRLGFDVDLLNKQKGLDKDKQIEKLKRELKNSRREIGNIMNSYTYRIGRFCTFLPRKVRGGIRCIEENGMKYTCKRFVEQVTFKG